MDTYRVKVYRMEGGSPDPGVDTLLGIDTTFDAGGGWSINTTGWSEGWHTVYAMAEDLAGNESVLDTVSVASLPDPMRVSGFVSWTIGEVGSVVIGSFSS